MSANPFIDLLGRRAKDRVTGFVGVVCTVSFDLFGCVQVVLVPPIDKDGNKGDGHWFDVNRLEVDASAPRVMTAPDFVSKVVDGGVASYDHGPSEKPSESEVRP